jgi:hypothetical protein
MKTVCFGGDLIFLFLKLLKNKNVIITKER